MQTVRKLRKRSGFTLVELLIVIIIIGILAGAMMLIAGSGSDRAEATKIISDLRSMKAAALMYYADGNKTVPGTDPIKALNDYMDRVISGDYLFEEGTTDTNQWYVGRNNIPPSVGSSLAKNATESALLLNTASADLTVNKYAGGDTVYMRAR